MGELTDIFDKNGERTGKTMLRGEKLSEGDYIQAAVAVVKSGSHVLVTRRHPDKSQGGKWEFPGGGSRSGEEPLETMLRELSEETGIQTYKELSTFLKRVYFEPYHLFVYVYLVESEAVLGELTLQKEEVTKAMFVTWEELSMMRGMLSPMNQQIYDEISEQMCAVMADTAS